MFNSFIHLIFIILHEIRKRKANWIGHILHRNCLLKQVIEGKIKREMEVARRRGRRRKKLLDELKERRGYSHLKEKALDHTVWRNRFGGGFGPVVRQNTEWMNGGSFVCMGWWSRTSNLYSLRLHNNRVFSFASWPFYPLWIGSPPVSIKMWGLWAPRAVWRFLSSAENQAAIPQVSRP